MQKQIDELNAAMQERWSEFYDAKRKLELTENVVPMSDYADAIRKRAAWHNAGAELIEALRTS
jgi:hypothetical protein